ncbi:MAG: YndJ family transporter [Verrucomicrobiota bacterium]
MQTLRTDSPEELSRTFRVLGHLGLWLGYLVLALAMHPAHAWVSALLLFSAVILMPLGEPLLMAAGILPKRDPVRFFYYLFLVKGLVGAGNAAGALFASCWLMVRADRAVRALWQWRKSPSTHPADLCLLAAAVFPAIGAMWLVAFCAGWMPFGFDALIVLLTAAHFHHAGFTLPLIAGLLGRARPGRWTSWSCIAVLAGVPLVAAGITFTHFGMLPWVEPLGVMVLVLGAVGVALSQMMLGFQKRHPVWTRTAFMFSGLSLLIAMLLALGFGVRYFIPSLALTMPQMWAIHGSLNAFGFGLLGLLAWTRDNRYGSRLGAPSTSTDL